MKLSCSQMDILISFYIENEISQCLKKQVEEHLDECSSCSAKYDFFKSMVFDMKSINSNGKESTIYSEELSKSFTKTDLSTSDSQYGLFRTNLSAYIDNELTGDENVKIRKYTICNKQAKQDLIDSYNIRKLMKDSFKKTKSDFRKDFSKKILKQLELEEEAVTGFHPAIRLLIIFTISVLIITTFALFYLSY